MNTTIDMEKLEEEHRLVQKLANDALYSALLAIARAYRIGQVFAQLGASKLDTSEDLSDWRSSYEQIAKLSIDLQSIHTTPPATIRKAMAIIGIP